MNWVSPGLKGHWHLLSGFWTNRALGVEEDKPQVSVTLTLAAAGGGQVGKQSFQMLKEAGNLDFSVKFMTLKCWLTFP